MFWRNFYRISTTEGRALGKGLQMYLQRRPKALLKIMDEFQGTLSGYKMRSSMSRKGNCWDNAPTESLWGRLKVGRLYGQRFATRRQAMDGMIDWLTF